MPILQFTSIYFLIIIFNSIDLTSIKRLAILMNFYDNFISFSNKFWKFINVLWSIISGFLLDNYKFKKFFMYLLLIFIFFNFNMLFYNSFEIRISLFNVIN